MKIGACGIACEVCGYFTKGMCEGCVAGNDEGASKKLDIQKKKLGFSCPVLECAFTARWVIASKTVRSSPVMSSTEDSLIVRDSWIFSRGHKSTKNEGKEANPKILA